MIFLDDQQFWFETVRLLGAEEGGSFGEVSATREHIPAGDYDSWHDAWCGIADRLAAQADAAPTAAIA